MFSQRKVTTLGLITLLSTSLLVGCGSSSTSSSSSGGGNTVDASVVLANQNARAAIAMAIDKEAYCDVILNNGSIPTSTYTPEGLAIGEDGKDYTELTKDFGYDYNEEMAKELWQKAKEEVGFDSVEIDLLTFDHDNGKKTAEFIQGELKDLEGLNIKISNLPFAQKLEKESAGDFDISFTGWGADYPDPLTFLNTMENTGSYAKQTGYDSEEYNKLVEEAKNSTNSAEAYQKFAEAEKLMLEDGYLLPLFQKGVAYVQKDYVSGIIENTWGADYTYKYADVDKSEKVLNLVSASDIPTLDPSKATDAASFLALNNVMEGLTRVNEEGKAEPGVAESWEVSEDGLTWTFKLRNNAKWSNGDNVTAKDFEYSFKRTLDPSTASEYTYIMSDIVGASLEEIEANGLDGVGVKALDDYTLEIKLKRPVSYFAELMSFGVFMPQNQAFVESCGDSYGTSLDKQLYNGPFVLSSWKKEDSHAYSKNPDYWDKDSVKLETINFKVVKETGAAVNLYKDGQIDRVGLSSEYVDEFKDSSEFKTAEDASVFMLQVNAGNQN